MDPVQTIKDQSKVTSSDYQEVPTHDYSNPNYEEHNVPYEYEISTLRGLQEEEMYAEAVPEGEKIYEDPGHVEEHIYAWFEERKFRKLKKNDIRFALAKLELFHYCDLQNTSQTWFW